MEEQEKINLIYQILTGLKKGDFCTIPELIYDSMRYPSIKPEDDAKYRIIEQELLDLNFAKKIGGGGNNSLNGYFEFQIATKGLQCLMKSSERKIKQAINEIYEVEHRNARIEKLTLKKLESEKKSRSIHFQKPMDLKNQILILKPELDSLIESSKGKSEELQEEINKLHEKMLIFKNNWVGSWGEHSYNHYNNFESLREEKGQVDVDGVLTHIEKLTMLNVKETKKEVFEIESLCKDFQNMLITELSIIQNQEDFNSESKLLEEIESQDWGMSSIDYIKSQRPKSIITYSPELLNRGLQVPPHLVVEGELISLTSTLESTKEFKKKANRILRQLEIKSSINGFDVKKNDFLNKLLNSFHNIAIQITKRYNNRDSIIISDEYDVQDLLHGLLRIEYNDVREEEHTPSYAGSATRMDFLLKEEKIVIEVKKTRKGLDGKEVSNQLIIDAAHYKEHPDCKHLICFVYDPERRVKNPRGLENDLNKLSTNDLTVETYIRPL